MRSRDSDVGEGQLALTVCRAGAVPVKLPDDFQTVDVWVTATSRAQNTAAYADCFDIILAQRPCAVSTNLHSPRVMLRLRATHKPAYR